VKLTDNEKSILDGAKGEAPRIALAILKDLGELFGAEELMPVSQVHIDATLYMVDAGVEFAEKLAALGGRSAVPTSLNPSAIDLLHPERLRVPPELLQNSRKLETAYLEMGAAPTWTCAPYQQGLVPRFGEQIAWAESNAIAFANSIIGARTNRYADLVDICASIVGKVPEFGLHLDKNRRAEQIIRLEGFTGEMFRDEKLYPLLGYVFGSLAGDQVTALTGMPPAADIDALKGFSAAAASTGAVGLFHLVGITPEAPDLEACTRSLRPKEEMVITPDMLRAAEATLNIEESGAVDWIALGCPHYSFAEFRSLAKLLDGRRLHGDTAMWIYTSRAVYGWIENRGILSALNNSGVTVFTDGCPLQFPRNAWSFSRAMSNSAKFTHYCFSQTGYPAILGSTAECVETAVTGKIQRRKSPWH
jgi:predicted aconitase